MVLTEYYALCDGGVCQDLLTETEKRDMSEGKAFYIGTACTTATYICNVREAYLAPIFFYSLRY